ncbi:MAG TPA: hypothetical protein VGX03_26145 [Candidatus Binatia bacterium]|jgi:hypothetical protein|nr:hypothetical protein [Candidatus Binatia bacterium]
MVTKPSLIILSGYLVRYPLGGYAWQIAHYLLGLRALGYNVWFYEDTGHYGLAYNPMTNEAGPVYDYGIHRIATFLDQIGFGDRWVFVDTERGSEHGPGAGRSAALLREADLLVNLGGVNHILPERRGGRPAIYIDTDPAYTQLKLANGDELLRTILDEHVQLFTFGENIGTSRSPLPTGGYLWHPTRQPVATTYWSHAGPPRSVYTTVGKWDEGKRDFTYRGETFHWRKRSEWLRCLDLPSRSGAAFEIAMDVCSVAGDAELLAAHGWRVVDPYAVSADPWQYRDYLRSSRGEFTVAKDMNIRLRSGWFSDRAACYLAAGRPVVEQDTAFGDVLPVGPGLHAFRTVEEATEAVCAIEADYDRASAHAVEVAREYFAAEKVLQRLLQDAGM